MSDKYLIKNTTKEQRLQFVKNAYVISSSGNKKPDEETVRILKQYVNGEKELEEVQKEIVERYKK